MKANDNIKLSIKIDWINERRNLDQKFCRLIQMTATFNLFLHRSTSNEYSSSSARLPTFKVGCVFLPGLEGTFAYLV